MCSSPPGPLAGFLGPALWQGEEKKERGQGDWLYLRRGTEDPESRVNN